LQEQLVRFGGAAKGRIMEMGAARFLRTSPEPFDIAFLDPPFGKDALSEYMPMLEEGHWIKPNGLVYLENERAAGEPKLPDHWELLKSKSAGEVGYHLARVNGRK
jgi:16S rRNA (guanine966-N2)-methyltransferase